MVNDNKMKFEVVRDSKIKKEISNRVFIPVIKAVNERGMAFRDFLEGIPYDESYLLNKRQRVEWWVYCKIISNMRPYFSPLDFENIGADFVRSGSHIEGVIGFFLFTSKKFSKLFADRILKRSTSNILCPSMQIEYIGSNKIRFTLLVSEGYEHIPEFAYGNKGIIRELGIHAGLKDCKVELQFIPQGAIYEATWRKEGIFFKFKRAIRWLFHINKAFWELTDSNEELLKEYEELEDYKNNLEKKVDERTSEVKKARDQLSETIILLQEAQLLQNRFFANISHEFRTPLTLILGPVKQTIEIIRDEKIKNDLKVVHKNANRLLGLVNQLLDISKLESGSMKLQTIPQNIVPLLKALALSFTSYAERKRITLTFNSVEDEILAYIDKDKIEKIITNVLSNAFKFTPEGGKIEVAVKSEPASFPPLVKPACPVGRGESKGGYVDISIRDTGIGIPDEKIPKIFDRFYQVDGSQTREQVEHPAFGGEGTGIGLSLTKELVELHKGRIDVESEEGKGTTFTISIPLGKEHLKLEEICEPEKEEKIPLVAEEMIYHEEAKVEKADLALVTKMEKSFLLIVEDNSDVRNYIRSNLEKEYRILEAIDGEDGWNKSIESATGGPDLIVSDVMMPKMDGFKLCDKLKTDERTSHIPVILLTAKASSQDKIEGFETGADDYIMKPFDTEELRARIRNLIGQRKRIHEHFRKRGLFEIEEEHITPVDQRFLQKTATIINEHISDASFGVEMLADEMAVSRSLLLKKIEALIGEPPNELIKRTRLNKAAKLIESRFGNISEIALEVGFSNPSYFAECFKKQFGFSPSQYHHSPANQ
jgi:signal transduction histidine kinase/DNA-binding response OmpR family regulator